MLNRSATSLLTVPPPAYRSSNTINVVDAKITSISEPTTEPEMNLTQIELDSQLDQSSKPEVSSSRLESQTSQDRLSPVHTNPPFKSGWLAYTMPLSFATNVTAYAIMFCLLKALSKATGVSIFGREVPNQPSPSDIESLPTNQSDPVPNSRTGQQSMSKLCSVLSAQHLSSLCEIPPGALQSEVPAAPIASAQPSILQYRTKIILLSGILAFLAITTMALLILDLLLHVYIVKRRPDLLRQKLGDEEVLAEMKVGWSHTRRSGRKASTSRASNATMNDEDTGQAPRTDTNMDEMSSKPTPTPESSEPSKLHTSMIRTLQLFRRITRTAEHRLSNTTQVRASYVTIVSPTRWTFSRLFLIVPIWIPLTEHPRWDFAALQGVMGLVVGFVMHRRSQVEVRRW